MLGLLDTAGFPLPEADRALNTVTAYAIDIAMGEAAWHNWLTRHDQTQQDWIDHAMSVAEEATTEDYPRLRTVVAGYAGKEPQRAMDDDFDYGLERVLDGLQARLDAT
jgi:hypothetical protein